jgi:hypothetical protein
MSRYASAQAEYDGLSEKEKNIVDDWIDRIL